MRLEDLYPLLIINHSFFNLDKGYQMEIERSCKGCDDYNDGCIIHPEERIKCPCQICLIKGMCQDACEEFEKTHYARITEEPK